MPLSIVVPVYNAEQSLGPLTERIQQVLVNQYAPVELILVNDCSHDGSWLVIKELQRRYPWVRGINMMRNFGQHNAILCGIRGARYPVIVTMDDDLQNPPEEVPAMIEKLKEGFDVVYGTPHAQAHGFFRNLASTLTKLVLQGAMGAETARNVSAFRVIRTQIRAAFSDYRSPYVSIDVLLTWGTKRFTAIRVRNDPRQSGVSNYTMRKLIIHALNMMTGFSTLPLQISSIIGFAFMLFGIAIFLYVFGRYLVQGAVVPGFPFLASIIAIFSGIQLFALGVIGEYLARIHVRSMDQPSYVIQQESGD